MAARRERLRLGRSLFALCSSTRAWSLAGTHPSRRFGDCSPIANTLRPVFTLLTAHMTLDLVRLLLFPSLMAFAAVSDLMTMSISNRISLLLVAGFVVLGALGGMSLYAISMHLAAGAA